MVKISKLEIENVKRVKAIALEPAENGLTVIGGKNGQGKTSVLDAITWALAGERYRPSQAQREGSLVPPSIRVKLSNGMLVERKGKNSSLKVIDPSGNLAGQRLLDGFVSTFALDVPKFMDAPAKEKANILLDACGLRDKVLAITVEEESVYNERHAIGIIADRKKKYAEEQPYYPTAPDAPVSASELLARHQTILANNAENQRKRERLNAITMGKHRLHDELSALDDRIAELTRQREEKLLAYNTAVADEQTAMKTVLELHDESTAEIEEDIANIEEINRKVRANLDKQKAEDDAKEQQDQYNALTMKLEGIRQRKRDLLANSGLPLPGLTIEDGELRYDGKSWDCMSASEQLRIATAIVRKLNPECGFVLMDKLEQLDLDTLREFGTWLESEGLQMIATRVSTGDECAVIIEDGAIKQNGPQTDGQPVHREWKKGEF